MTGAVAVVYTWICIRILQVSLPEIHDKLTEVDGLTVLQLLLVKYDCARQSMHAYGGKNVG